MGNESILFTDGTVVRAPDDVCMDSFFWALYRVSRRLGLLMVNKFPVIRYTQKPHGKKPIANNPRVAGDKHAGLRRLVRSRLPKDAVIAN